MVRNQKSASDSEARGLSGRHEVQDYSATKGIVVVMVRPTGANNVGSVARLLKNFRFHELRLVQPSEFIFQRELGEVQVEASGDGSSTYVYGSAGITEECYEYATPGGAYVLDSARIYGAPRLP